jgi:hypothetical protein
MSRSVKITAAVALGALAVAAAVGTAMLVPSRASTVAGNGYLTGQNPTLSAAPTASGGPARRPGATTPTANPTTGGGKPSGPRSMTLPAEFTSLLPSYPKLTDAVGVFNGLPPAGQATIGRIAAFLAQNPGQTENVCTHLADVLTGQLVVDGLTVSTGQLPGGTGIPSGGDIEALAFIVLMEATNDQDDDLQEIMNEVQAQTKAKQFLRQQMQIVDTDVANNAAQQTAQPNGSPLPSASGPPFLATRGLRYPINEPFYTTFQMPAVVGATVTYHTVDLTSGQPLTTITQLQGIQTELQGDFDAMNDMSESTAMRLRAATDARANFDGTLPQLLSDIADASAHR